MGVVLGVLPQNTITSTYCHILPVWKWSVFHQLCACGGEILFWSDYYSLQETPTVYIKTLLRTNEYKSSVNTWRRGVKERNKEKRKLVNCTCITQQKLLQNNQQNKCSVLSSVSSYHFYTAIRMKIQPCTGSSRVLCNTIDLGFILRNHFLATVGFWK